MRITQRCSESIDQRVAPLLGLRRGVEPVQTRGGRADTARLKIQSPPTSRPPPETSGSARATEREIKQFSAGGRLADYRIFHFATHGTLAGQLSGTTPA